MSAQYRGWRTAPVQRDARWRGAPVRGISATRTRGNQSSTNSAKNTMTCSDKNPVNRHRGEGHQQPRQRERRNRGDQEPAMPWCGRMSAPARKRFRPTVLASAERMALAMRSWSCAEMLITSSPKPRRRRMSRRRLKNRRRSKSRLRSTIRRCRPNWSEYSAATPRINQRKPGETMSKRMKA